MSDSGLTWEELHTALAEVLGEPAGADDNLIELGMDSIRLMRLTGRLRRRGVEIRFAELAERPTLAGWWDLLADKGQVEAAAGPAAHVSEALGPADIERIQKVARDSPEQPATTDLAGVYHNLLRLWADA